MDVSLFNCPSVIVGFTQAAADTIRAVDTYSVKADTLGERGGTPELYNSEYVKKAINSTAVKNKSSYLNKKAHNSQIKIRKVKNGSNGENSVEKQEVFRKA